MSHDFRKEMALSFVLHSPARYIVSDLYLVHVKGCKSKDSKMFTTIARVNRYHDEIYRNGILNSELKILAEYNLV